MTANGQTKSFPRKTNNLFGVHIDPGPDIDLIMPPFNP